MILLVLTVAMGAGIVWQLSYHGLITFPTQQVQSYPQRITYGVPTWLKGTVIALIVLRLIFSLGYLADKPFNADEVRGFYRLSGYSEAEIKRDAFRGQILTAQALQTYQTPAPPKTLGNALTALATSPEHTPGYYVLSRFWLMLWSDPLSARILAVLIGLVYLPCAYWLCLELVHSAWAGWIAIALLSLSPYHMLLSQGARQYSLFTLLLLASGLCLLRAMRLGNGRHWLAYGISVALGLYSHLFFVLLLVAHGLYVVAFGRRQLVTFFAAAAASLLSFSPWLWVIFSSLNQLDENTQGVQNRRTTLLEIIRFSGGKVGDLFLNLNNTSAIERLADPLLLGLIALAFYCLVRGNPSRVWSFVLLPMVINYGSLVLLDLLLGGGRSLRSRYLLMALLSVTLAVACFLANAMQRSKYGWERLAWTGVFSVLVAGGVASGVMVAHTPGLDYLEHGRTASVVNQELAPLINASDSPLVISAATHSFVLALSHEVNQDVNFQLVQALDPNEWEGIINVPGAIKTYSDVFVYFPNQEFLTFLDADATLVPVFEETLYRVIGE